MQVDFDKIKISWYNIHKTKQKKIVKNITIEMIDRFYKNNLSVNGMHTQPKVSSQWKDFLLPKR